MPENPYDRFLLNWEVFSKDDAWDLSMNPKVWVPVLHASDRWYEAWHVGDPSVVLKDGRYYMAYSATSKHFEKRDGFPATMVQCVMGAVPEDGIQWKKTDEPNSFTQPGSFEVQHDLRKPLIEGWPNPEIIRIDHTYHCFSDAPGYPIKQGESPWKGRQLREAVSNDGITWQRQKGCRWGAGPTVWILNGRITNAMSSGAPDCAPTICHQFVGEPACRNAIVLLADDVARP